MTAWKHKEQIGDCTLYLGDCLEVMPTLGKVDAVVTDPPYGIGFGRFNRTNKDRKGNRFKADKYKHGEWDDQFDFTPFYQMIQDLCVPAIIWGGNYFPCLWTEGAKGFIFWHKHQPVTNFSKGELAWSNIDMPAKFIDFPYFGGVEGRTKAGEKLHPTQKPVPVMQDCLGFLPDAETILDPFMGSGTTLVACAKLGRKGIGIELDPDYYEIACKRVEESYRQPDLFVAPPSQPRQDTMEF